MTSTELIEILKNNLTENAQYRCVTANAKIICEIRPYRDAYVFVEDGIYIPLGIDYTIYKLEGRFANSEWIKE